MPENNEFNSSQVVYDTITIAIQMDGPMHNKRKIGSLFDEYKVNK